MSFAGQASGSNKFAMLWAADYRNSSFSDLEGYLRELALRVTWLSFGNTAVLSFFNGILNGLHATNLLLSMPGTPRHTLLLRAWHFLWGQNREVAAY
jgi:hypothetical protein